MQFFFLSSQSEREREGGTTSAPFSTVKIEGFLRKKEMAFQTVDLLPLVGKNEKLL